MKSLQDIMAPFYKEIKVKNLRLLQNKTFLITGASGLIGSNLIAYLDFLNKKHGLNIKIIGIVRSQKEEWMAVSKNIKYLKKDLTIESLNNDIKFDYLIHFATYGQPKKFLAHPQETIELNIHVLFKLLKLAEKNNAVFLYPSSSEIYGEADNKHIPTDETYFGYVNTLSERAIYAESKRLAETICFLFSKKLCVKIARFLICYGPGVKSDDQRVYCEFIKKAQNTGEIIMMDEGKAQRALCFISDAIEMLLNVLLNGKANVYNICGTETVTILELAKIITDINHAKVSNYVQNKNIGGTPTRSTLSNKRYCHEFKKKKFVSLKKGLYTTSQWFNNINQ